MAQIQVNDLTFAYPGSWDPVFEHVSLVLDTDWKLGFCGRNGRGKTTFLRLLLGEYPYEGSISWGMRCAYFPYTIQNPSLMTLDALQQLDSALEDWQLCVELGRLQVDAEVLYRPFSTLSAGEQTKVLLAALFLRENRFLLIDEPTNHLDALGRAALADYLQSKKGFLLVSHDRMLLDACTDHTLSINRANIEVQQGSFSVWYENKMRRDAFELAENDRLKKDIRRLEAAARQSKEWADKSESIKIGKKKDKGKFDAMGGRAYIGEQSRRMQQRRKNLERRQQNAIHEKSSLLHNIEEAESLKLHPLAWHTARLADLRDVSLFYGETCILRHLNLSVMQGERIAVTGANGSGKSTLLKLLVGEDIRYTGSFVRGTGLKISYVMQNSADLSGDLDAYAHSYGIDIPLFCAILRKLDFSRAQFEKPMESYSAGQKKKVLIARSLCEEAHLYVWDEPLNYIDLWSRMQIEELLLTFQPTIVFIEHDRAFCDHVATKQICVDAFMSR
ncbi:MAG: ABC-F type ribosomal protection protein [Clostridia bacterium]|nr:ABC-F type ribosomal protection protein [Clostridia bacterium]